MVIIICFANACISEPHPGYEMLTSNFQFGHFVHKCEIHFKHILGQFLISQYISKTSPMAKYHTQVHGLS